MLECKGSGGEGPVCEVYLLGPLRIVRAGKSLEGGWRRKAVELLAYLAVNPQGVSKDQILEALWPEGDPQQTQHYLWHSVSRLRNRLRGERNWMKVVAKVDEIYRLDRESVWADVVEFQESLFLAKRASDPREALEAACDIYKGEFCEGRYFGWGTLVRERLHCQFIEASRNLAEVLQRYGDIDAALTVLDRALEFEPSDEDLARRAMVLNGQRGRVDLVVRRYKQLRRVLIEELGAEPSRNTVDCFNTSRHRVDVSGEGSGATSN